MRQMDFILKQLCLKGEITRNECLRNFISRLSARIYDLKQDGWDIEGFYRPVIINGEKVGMDYVYKVIRKPIDFDCTKFL
jgi:hypothetical protein